MQQVGSTQLATIYYILWWHWVLYLEELGGKPENICKHWGPKSRASLLRAGKRVECQATNDSTCATQLTLMTISFITLTAGFITLGSPIKTFKVPANLIRVLASSSLGLQVSCVRVHVRSNGQQHEAAQNRCALVSGHNAVIVTSSGTGSYGPSPYEWLTNIFDGA